MQVSEIEEILQRDFPEAYAYDWDNVGLLIGRREKEVSKVYVAVDATDAVISDAIDKEADLILTHHPLIFEPIKRVCDTDFLGKRILTLIQSDLACYAMHTNYDVLRMADLAAEKLGLPDPEVLEVTVEEPVKRGIGKVADLKEAVPLKEMARQVKEVFSLPDVRAFGDPDQMVRRIAILPGSGKGSISTAIRMGADVMITGDIGHHEGIDAAAQGLFILDAGHYGIEHIFIDDMADYLQKNLPEVQVFKADIVHPYTAW